VNGRVHLEIRLGRHDRVNLCYYINGSICFFVAICADPIFKIKREICSGVIVYGDTSLCACDVAAAVGLNVVKLETPRRRSNVLDSNPTVSLSSPG
jgi:hypothetical protein